MIYHSYPPISIIERYRWCPRCSSVQSAPPEHLIIRRFICAKCDPGSGWARQLRRISPKLLRRAETTQAIENV